MTIKEAQNEDNSTEKSMPLGNVLAPQLAGVLSVSQWGWPSVYWAVGVIDLICFLLLTMFGSETPLKHSSIKEEEKNYILGSTNNKSAQKLKIPWMAIFKSRPVWAAFIGHVGSSVCFAFLYIEVPSYIYYIYGSDIKSSGLLSSLPHICSIFTGILFGFLSDFITNKKIVRVKNARRIFNSISQSGIAFALICVSFTNNIALGVTCFIIAMSTDSASHVGWMVSYIDLAPNFSGILMTIGNAFMNVFLILLPVVVSFAVADQTDIMQWRLVLFILAAVSIIANTIFVCMISAETQPWNCVDDNNCTEKETNDDTKEKTRL